MPLTHRHECRVKHVVIESKRDPVTGVIYNITPNGPFFSSLSELIDEAQKKALIQNHTFDIKLGQYPPQVSGWGDLISLYAVYVELCTIAYT